MSEQLTSNPPESKHGKTPEEVAAQIARISSKILERSFNASPMDNYNKGVKIEQGHYGARTMETKDSEGHKVSLTQGDTRGNGEDATTLNQEWKRDGDTATTTNVFQDESGEQGIWMSQKGAVRRSGVEGQPFNAGAGVGVEGGQASLDETVTANAQILNALRAKTSPINNGQGQPPAAAA